MAPCGARGRALRARWGIRLLAAGPFALAFVLGLVSLAAGCNGRKTVSNGPIAQLFIFSEPAPRNFDDDREADGFRIRVYAVHHGEVKGTRITSGVVKLRLYDGVVTLAQADANEPILISTFTPAELDRRRSMTRVGHKYDFIVRWDERPPRSEQVTLLVEWQGPAGEIVVAEPVRLSLRRPRRSADTPARGTTSR